MVLRLTSWAALRTATAVALILLTRRPRRMRMVTLHFRLPADRWLLIAAGCPLTAPRLSRLPFIRIRVGGRGYFRLRRRRAAQQPFDPAYNFRDVLSHNSK
jgi:hypothetical protein